MAQLRVVSNARPNAKKAGGSRSRTESFKYGFGEHGERAVAFSSIGCVGSTWQDFEQAFAATCAAHRKKPRIELYHVEESFSREEADPDDPAAAERVNALGRKFARKVWPDRQVVVVTQKDGKSGLLHNHILVNNPHTLTGLMCRGDDMTWERLMPLHDALLEAEGTPQPEKMPETVAEAKARARLTREAVYAEGEAHLRTILAASPKTLEEANQVAPEGVSLVDEPRDLRAKRGARDTTGMRMRLLFTDSQGRKKAFDINRTSISRDDMLGAFAHNAQQTQPAPPPPPPIPPVQPAVRPVILLGGVGFFKDEPDRTAMRLAGYTSDEITAAVAAHDATLGAKATTLPEPSGTKSPTEASKPSRTASEPPAATPSAQVLDDDHDGAERPSVVAPRVPLIDNAWMDELIVDEPTLDPGSTQNRPASGSRRGEGESDAPIEQAVDKAVVIPDPLSAHVQPTSGPEVVTEDDELEDAVTSRPKTPVAKSLAEIVADLWEEEHGDGGDNENDDPQPGD